MAENVRADMTFMGYFLIGLFLLVFGILGLQDAGLFGELDYTAEEFSHTLPVSWIMVTMFALVIAVALTIYSIFMYRTGNKSAMAIFILFATALFAYGFLSIGHEIFMYAIMGKATIVVSTSWFIYIIFAIIFFILALYLLVDRAPKFIALFTLILGIMFLFVGLAYYFYASGGSDGIIKAMSIVFGIFALLGFILATYIGLVYSAPRARLPLI